MVLALCYVDHYSHPNLDIQTNPPLSFRQALVKNKHECKYTALPDGIGPLGRFLAATTVTRPLMWTAVILLAIAAMLTTLAFSKGVYCADDASFAVVSRSIAEGRGYTITINYNGEDFKPQIFPPALGEGPTSILPVALGIYLFGAQPWVPGFTHVLMAVTLLAGFSALMARPDVYSRLPLLLLMFWVLVLSLSSRVFCWAAQIGEPIAALLVICGYAAWTTVSRRVLAAALSGLLLGLAVLTKEMAGLYVLSFVAAVFVQRMLEIREHPLESGDVRAAMALIAFGMLPFLMFELWRLKALGPEWWPNWEAHIAFIGQQSAGAFQSADFGRVIAERTNTIREYFFPSALLLIGLAGASLAITMKYGTPMIWRLALILSWGIAIHLFYWLLLSNGWPRYLYIAVVLWCALAALPILVSPPKRLIIIYLAVLAVIPISGLTDLPSYRSIWDVATGRAVRANADERNVLGYLAREAPNELVYSSWWAHVASLEYLSDRPGRFQGGAIKVLDGTNGGRRAIRDTPTVHVIMNMKLLRLRVEQDIELLGRLSRCGAPVFISGQYNVFRCHM